MNTKRLLPLTLLLSVFVLIAARPKTTTPLTFSADSNIRIEGTSSLHDWTCEASPVGGSLMIETIDGVLTGIEQASAALPVSAIDCDNGTMNKKVRDALEAKAHPVIRYELKSARVTTADGRVKVEAAGQLTLAGVQKPFALHLQGSALENGRYRFQGSAPLLMSDFGIKAPTAMLGTLKTGDAVMLHFDVIGQPMAAATTKTR